MNGGLHKVAWPLHIPGYLDLSEYLDKEAKTAGVTAQYRLSGVISHTGNPEIGHYISYVKHHAYHDKWVQIDDEDVSWSSFSEAVCADEAPARYNSSFFPYILAYTKVHDCATDAIYAADIGE
jgi:ubiquitin C-terminal hydrolase